MSASANSKQAWEAVLADACRQAGLTPLQTTVILLELVEGLTPREIRLKLGRSVDRELAIARARLAGLPGFWQPANEFPKQLVFCAADRRRYDDRPPEVSGVQPANESKGFRAGPLIAADDRRIRQDLKAAVRLWALELRGP